MAITGTKQQRFVKHRKRRTGFKELMRRAKVGKARTGRKQKYPSKVEQGQGRSVGFVCHDVLHGPVNPENPHRFHGRV